MQMTTIAPEPTRTAQPKPTPREIKLQQLRVAAPFVLPGLVLVLVFVVWPLVRGLQMSLYDWNLPVPSRSQFVGLHNFARAFTQDPTFWVATRNTFLYVIVTVPLQIAFGLLIAVLLNDKIRGRGVFRTMFYLPVVTSWLIVSFVFAFLFSDGDGPVNYLLTRIGLIDTNVAWLHSTWTAQVPIMLLGIWKGIGWNMVIFLAALQSIPEELSEAAILDGANAWQRFRRVTLPLLRPTFQFVSIALIIGGFNVFISVYLITGGGPEHSTEVLLSYMYSQAFTNLDFGYGTAIGLILGATVMVFGFLQRRITRGAID